MDEEFPVLMPSSSVIWSIVHHVFVAAVVLLANPCFNWDELIAKTRKEEVLAACRLSARAHETSNFAWIAIDFMMAVLWRRWKRKKQKAMRQEGQPLCATHADRGEAVIFPQRNVTRSESGHIYPAPAQLDSSQTHLDDIHLKDSWMTMLQEIYLCRLRRIQLVGTAGRPRYY